MKRFLKRVALFSLCAIFVTELLCTLSIASQTYKYIYPAIGSTIYRAIRKSKSRQASKKIVLGDSVGYQLFPNKNEAGQELNSLTSNQAIGVIGNYFLLNNYIRSGNSIDVVYLITTPFFYLDNLDQPYTYNYFLKPFYHSEYKKLFTETATRQVQKIPCHQFCRVPHILATAWAPDFETRDDRDYTFLSPLSAEYLSRIKALSIKHNFELILLPTPTRLDRKIELDRMDKAELLHPDLADLFHSYFDKIIYLDSTHFVDQVHLHNPIFFAEEYKAEWMR